jgi:hypothetical protein
VCSALCLRCSSPAGLTRISSEHGITASFILSIEGNSTSHACLSDAVHHFHQVPLLKDYPSAFFRDVTKTVSDLRTALPAKVERMTPFDRVRRHYKDLRVYFSNLGLRLRNGDEGRQKCRYHQHGKGALCWHMIT